MQVRRLALTLSLLSLALPALARAGGVTPPGACQGLVSDTRLIVEVEGVRSADGLVAVTLYPDDASRFLAHHGSLKVVRTPARAGATDVCLYLPAPGYYAVAVYHDANGDHRLDRSGLMPREGSGLSNNPQVSLLHWPSYKASRFPTHAGDNHIAVTLHYPH
jgi:uncharacterized protein (DUF2141 family)